MQLINAVDAKCKTLKTHPDLRALLITSLTKWIHWTAQDPNDQFTIQPDPNANPAMIRLIVRQNEIGWKHIMLGRFCKTWSEIQDDHYATCST